MASIYDRTELYDLFDTPNRQAVYREHWHTLFAGKQVHTMLDVSIGSGSVTLPALELNVSLCGSDLSEPMLTSCAQKLDSRGLAAELHQADFSELSIWAGRQFDFVVSSGSSLGYVENADVARALWQMDALVAPGGWLCFDTRNWDYILQNRPRFYLYDPLFDGDTRINLIQVWDYELDGSVLFHLLYTFERENHIFQKEKFEEHYHPFFRALWEQTLSSAIRIFKSSRSLPSAPMHLAANSTGIPSSLKNLNPDKEAHRHVSASGRPHPAPDA